MGPALRLSLFLLLSFLSFLFSPLEGVRVDAVAPAVHSRFAFRDQPFPTTTEMFEVSAADSDRKDSVQDKPAIELSDVFNPRTSSRGPRDMISPAMRNRANAVLSRFARVHRDNRARGASNDGRFLIMAHTNMGLGNYFLKLVQAVILGILTDRAVLVYGHNSRSSVFLEMFALPIDVSMTPEATEAYLSMPRFAPKSEVLRQRDTVLWGSDALPLCAPVQDTIGNATFAIVPDLWFTGFPFSLWRSPHRAFLEEAFGSFPMYFIGNWLFETLTNKHVIDLYQREHEHVFAGLPEDAFVLGVQLRWGRGKSDFYLTTEHDRRKFLVCAASVLRNEVHRGRPAAVILATDTYEIRQQVKTWFARHPDPLLRNVTVHHITPGREEGLAADGNMHLALVDHLLLARVDDMIVTRWSSFGWVAHARTLLRPLFASRLTGSCLRMVSSHQGMASLGGGWPWGELFCDQKEKNLLPCCAQDRSAYFTHFMPM
jgi:hypothetical protein